MKETVCIMLLLVFVFTVFTCYSEEIIVMDEYDLLSPDEVANGVLLDPETMFAYRVLEDDTVEILRYCWFHTTVEIPTVIDDKRVSSIGSYAFDETGVKDIFLSHEDIMIDECAFDYTRATIWIPAGHPTLRIFTGLMRKEDCSVECYSTTSYEENYRYYVEFDE